jgi:hypothetical protein
MADAEVYSLDNPSTRNSTLTMDTQRYDPAKRSFVSCDHFYLTFGH